MVFLMKKKSQVFGKFEEFFAIMSLMLGTVISKLTADEGREHCSGDQIKFYKAKGILIEATVAYSPT